MADQNHVAGGSSGGQGSTGGDRPNQDPAQDATVPTQADAGAEESGAGYGNNAGAQGEELGTTAEAHPS